MKNIIKNIIIILLTVIITYLLLAYTIKIEGIENGNVKINILGMQHIYYFEEM